MKRKIMVCYMAAAIVTLSGCTSAKAEETQVNVTTQTETSAPIQRPSGVSGMAESNKNELFELARVVEVKESTLELVIEKGEMTRPETGGETSPDPNKAEGGPSGQSAPELNEAGTQPGEVKEPPEGGEVPEPQTDTEKPERRIDRPGGFGTGEISWSTEQETIVIPADCKITVRQGKERLEGVLADVQVGNTIRLLYTADEQGQRVLTSIEVEQASIEGENKTE